MSKYLKEYYEMDTAAVGEGLSIKKIEYDFIITVYFVGFDNDMHKRTVRFDKEDKPYFTFRGLRRYLDNFLKVVSV